MEESDTATGSAPVMSAGNTADVTERVNSEMPRLAEAPARIALLLPASGPLAKSAEAVRDGFFAAYFYRLNKTYQPVIQVYDTGTHTDTMLTAYRQAVADGAGIVVGPLDREGVKTLVHNGGELSIQRITVPTLTLNYTDTPPSAPGYLYQFGLAP